MTFELVRGATSKFVSKVKYFLISNLRTAGQQFHSPTLTSKFQQVSPLVQVNYCKLFKHCAIHDKYRYWVCLQLMHCTHPPPLFHSVQSCFYFLDGVHHFYFLVILTFASGV